jgi:magnesium transporter
MMECTQAARQANIYTSVLGGLIDARGMIVNNNMNSLLTHRTLINIVFLPLDPSAGIGRMSEWSMMTKGMDWRISNGLFRVGMLLIGWLTWVEINHIITRSRQQLSLYQQVIKPRGEA